MLYRIDGNYYVKVGNKFAKVSINVDEKGELLLTPTNEKIENTNSLKVEPFSLATQKEEIIKNIKKSTKLFDEKSFNRKKSLD